MWSVLILWRVSRSIVLAGLSVFFPWWLVLVGCVGMVFLGSVWPAMSHRSLHDVYNLGGMVVIAIIAGIVSDWTFLVSAGIFLLICLCGLIFWQKRQAKVIYRRIERGEFVQAGYSRRRWFVAASLVLVLIAKSVHIDTNCTSLRNSRSLLPVSQQIDTGLSDGIIASGSLIVDGVAREIATNSDISWSDRLSQQRADVKNTTTTMVFSPQRMVFLSACNASLTLWQKVSASDLFQGGIVVVGVLLLVPLLEAPLWLLSFVIRGVLRLLYRAGGIKTSRVMVEVEVWGEEGEIKNSQEKTSRPTAM